MGMPQGQDYLENRLWAWTWLYPEERTHETISIRRRFLCSYIISRVLVGIQGCTSQADKNRDTEANLQAHRHRGTQAHTHKFACTCILHTYTHSNTCTHTHTRPAKQRIRSLTQPWNPLRLGDLAKQLIHSAFDLFPISSLQSANWEKQKRKGDCCTSPRDQTKESSRDTQRMPVCVD